MKPPRQAFFASGLLRHWNWGSMTSNSFLGMARCNPRRGRCLGVSLDCFTSKQHRGFSGCKAWGHEKSWFKASTNSPPPPLWICSTIMYGGHMALNSLTMVSRTLRLTNFTAKEYNVWTTFEIVSTASFSHGMRLRLSSISLQRRMRIGSHLRPKSLTNGSTY